MTMLPKPSRIGLPEHFTAWRPHQASSILRLIDSEKRFVALVAPTGSGKSLTYAAAARLLGGKSVILTSTKSLMDQLTKDFSSMGYKDVRGQSNYLCPIDPPATVDLGPCHAGVRCDLRGGGCPYYDAVRIASTARTPTITNYSWWLHNNKHAQPFPHVDNLILDEAHAAPDELAEFLAAEISNEQIRQFLNGYAPPLDMKYVVEWARSRCGPLEADVEVMKFSARKDRNRRRLLRAMQNLLLKVARLANAKPEDWVVEQSRRGYRFDPVWPGPYSETLFRDTERIILVSATMRPKTLQLLGIKEDDYDFFETPSTFSVARRPVIHFRGQPRVALTHKSGPGLLRLWTTRIDNLIRRRLDRKGIIHCVSYARRDYLLQNSRYREHFITHDSGEQARAVERFKAAKAPAIFISPSATTGLDFPYSECEYQIIAKVPFPDQRSKILKARSKLDPEYPMYLTMIDVVQATGRGMRAPDDQCETFIVDDQWQWVKKKYATFAPAWFLEANRATESVTDPPKKL